MELLVLSVETADEGKTDTWKYKFGGGDYEIVNNFGGCDECNVDQRGSVGNDYSSGSESSGSGGSEGTPEPVRCEGEHACHQEAAGEGSSQVIGRKK